MLQCRMFVLKMAKASNNKLNRCKRNPCKIPLSAWYDVILGFYMVFSIVSLHRYIFHMYGDDPPEVRYVDTSLRHTGLPDNALC